MKIIETVKEQNEELANKFQRQLQVNHDLNRQLVSFQANKKVRGYRWFKYKEGFSSSLISYLLERLNIREGTVIDPFAGAGTTLFVASELGLDAVGIELLPIGCEIIEVRNAIFNTPRQELLQDLNRWYAKKPWIGFKRAIPFPHLHITKGAFSAETEKKLGNFLARLQSEKNPTTQKILRFAVLCILEEISFTRKDGQYLRWDHRSGRHQGAKSFNKGPIKSFDSAITEKLKEILDDVEGNGDLFNGSWPKSGSGKIKIVQDSCLHVLPQLPENSFDCLVTSPPYCNRYDYTRTYALELALLGINEEGLKNLRQTMLSCTVENREKENLDKGFRNGLFARAQKAFQSQDALINIVEYLNQRKAEKLLNNNGIPRMVKNYFWEMTLVIFECARILKPGAPLIMVNDNVRYEGINVSVDLILSDIARQAGFNVEKIWVLPKGKGNSSQQMGEHGREELRKCVYIWRRPKLKATKLQDLQPASELSDWQHVSNAPF